MRDTSGCLCHCWAQSRIIYHNRSTWCSEKNKINALEQELEHHNQSISANKENENSNIFRRIYLRSSPYLAPSSLHRSFSVTFSAALNMPPSPHVNLLLQWHASLGGVISNNPRQSPYKCLWVMHWHVIQIIKHNGDNDAFLQFCFLPDTTKLNTNPPNNFSSPLPFHRPSWGRARTEPLKWIISFPWTFCHKKKINVFFYFWRICACYAFSQFHCVSWWSASRVKVFQGKKVHLLLAFPDLSQIK